MSTIPKSNVINGNTIQASDILNIIEALDGTSSTQLIISGSISGSNFSGSSFSGNGSNLNGVSKQLQVIYDVDTHGGTEGFHTIYTFPQAPSLGNDFYIIPTIIESRIHIGQALSSDGETATLEFQVGGGSITDPIIANQIDNGIDKGWFSSSLNDGTIGNVRNVENWQSSVQLNAFIQNETITTGSVTLICDVAYTLVKRFQQ